MLCEPHLKHQNEASKTNWEFSGLFCTVLNGFVSRECQWLVQGPASRPAEQHRPWKGSALRCLENLVLSHCAFFFPLSPIIW